MKELHINISYREYAMEELPENYKELVEKARGMVYHSYAPYSKFHVGAAVEMDGGATDVGANQENAAYPSGMCAERTVAYHASALYPGVRIRKIAVAAWTRLGKPSEIPDEECYQVTPISPCGACRQALLEYETLYGDMEVVLCGRDKVYVFPSVKSLLPFSFTEF